MINMGVGCGLVALLLLVPAAAIAWTWWQDGDKGFALSAAWVWLVVAGMSIAGFVGAANGT